MEDAVGRGVAGFGALQGLVEFALAQWADQCVGSLGGAGADSAQRPQAFEDDGQADDRDEDQRVRCIVALLDHLNNAELVLHRLNLPQPKIFGRVRWPLRLARAATARPESHHNYSPRPMRANLPRNWTAS